MSRLFLSFLYYFLFIYIHQMISFKYKSLVKKIKIQTHKTINEKMSVWLQKVFNFKGQIIGFRTPDNKYYDVSTFYVSIKKFDGCLVQIVQNDQIEISFTSKNLNSSSFVRPNQLTTSDIYSKDEQLMTISSFKQFQRKLTDSKEVVSVLFDTNSLFKKDITDGVSQLMGLAVQPLQVALYILINNRSPKDSTYAIYMGKTLLLKVSLTKRYCRPLRDIIFRYRNSQYFAKTVKFIEQNAPSFTTYHLQERLNQQLCAEYLQKMHKQKDLRNQVYYKLKEKLEDYSQFYRLFCEGIFDNDYDSFKNQITQKVANNLELILCNVDEMDLERPISREQKRNPAFRQPAKDIQILKVENYLQVLDKMQAYLSPQTSRGVKQLLLEQNEQVCGCFAQYESNKQQLALKLTAFIKLLDEDLRPPSQSIVPHSQAPMFGSLKESGKFKHLDPMKVSTDLFNDYRTAKEQLSRYDGILQAQEYGILGYYLQQKDQCLLQTLQDLVNVQNVEKTKAFLSKKIQKLLNAQLTSLQIAFISTQRSSLKYVYQNFKYQANPNNFIIQLKQQIAKLQPVEKYLHKKSSDSQLLESKKNENEYRRKYSDENIQDQFAKMNEQSVSKSSLAYGTNIREPWGKQFEQLLSKCKWIQNQRIQYLLKAFKLGDPTLFMLVKKYLQNKQIDVQKIKSAVVCRQDQDIVNRILPQFVALTDDLVTRDFLSRQVQGWVINDLVKLNKRIISAFDVYLQTIDQLLFSNTLISIFAEENSDENRLLICRIKTMLTKISANDHTGIEVFQLYPQQIKSIIQVFITTGDLQDMMDSMEILYKTYNSKRNITVATLNFSGINTSPLQYHDGSEQLLQIDSITQAIIKIEKPTLKNWGVGKIDKLYNKDRQCMGCLDFHLTSKNKLPNKQQFTDIWNFRFKKQELPFQKPPTEEEINNAIYMDYTFYRAALIYIEGKSETIMTEKNIEDFMNNVQNFNSKNFLTLMQKLHSNPSCSLQQKAERVIKFIKSTNVDVLCLQQANQVKWDEMLPKDYAIIKIHDSFLFYKTQKLGSPIKIDKYDLNFNKDSAYVFTDKNYLLISSHLSAKSAFFEKQAEQMVNKLEEVLSQLSNLRFIIGIDANHFLNNFPYALAPNIKQIPTTIKKRTIMQAQFQKANKTVSQVKDHILTNGTISNARIIAIDGYQSKNQLLPNARHPYDHYIVMGTIS